MQKNIASIALLLFGICLGTLLLHTYWTLAHTLTPDFSVYFQAAKNIQKSMSVYMGIQQFTLFAYPLVSGMFFLPFLAFPYQIAQTIFLSLSIVALGLISWLTAKLLLRKNIFLGALCIFGFAYLSFPTKFTLGMGQVNLIAYALLLCSVYFSIKRSSHAVMIGILAGLACLLKPILILFIVFFALQRQWKVLLFTVATFIVFFLVSLVVDRHALQDYFYYFFHVLPEVSKPVGKEIYYNQGWMSVVFREVPNQLARLICSYVGMAILAAGAVIAGIRSKNSLYTTSIFLTTIPLADTLSWQHHFILLIFPFSFAFVFCLKQKNIQGIAILVVAYFLVSWNFTHPFVYAGFPINLLFSNTFFGGLLLYIFLITHPHSFLERAKK